jgi:hypothetical protein
MNSTIGRVRRREVARRASPAAARASVKLHVFLASLGVRLGNRFGVSFPVQNLPFGVFSPEGGEVPPGVAIGDHILDLGALAASGLLSDDALAAAPAAGSTLNAMLGLGERPRCALRTELSRLLRVGGPATTVATMLHHAASCTIHLPCAVGDYTDFYVGIHRMPVCSRHPAPPKRVLRFVEECHGRSGSKCLTRLRP